MYLEDCYVGQKVLFRDYETLMRLNDAGQVRFGFSPKMKYLCERQFTIRKIDNGRIWFEEYADNDPAFQMRNGHAWSISSDMIEEYIKESAFDIGGDNDLIEMVLS